MLNGSKKSMNSNIWSLGILAYEIFVGTTPTHNKSYARAVKQIQYMN